MQAAALLMIVCLTSACAPTRQSTPPPPAAVSVTASPRPPQPTVTLAPLHTPTPAAAAPVADLEPRVADLVARMSLEEKVGQLFLVYFDGPTLSPALKTMIADYHVGGIVLFQIADNLQSARQAAELINSR
ncbi:MAG: hypothetical protein IPH87_16055, partial [Anaerolineae bacterium]|nr:hypothetical protein [Anaerolineae bacterium]